MDIQQLEVMHNYQRQKFLLEDSLSILEKIEYLFAETGESQEMKSHISYLIQGIKQNLSEYKGI